MTLHFHWLHAPRWMVHTPGNRAMTLVLGVIGISLLFSALRVVDAAISGALVERRASVAAPSPAGTSSPDVLLRTEPPASGAAVPTNDVEVPEATVEAISL